MSARVIAAILLTLGLVLCVKAWNTHLVNEGDARGADRVQTMWNTADAKRLADQKTAEAQTAMQRADAEMAARQAEQIKQQQAERNARDQAQRESALQATAVATAARNRSLLGTIAELDARNAELSRTVADARVTALALEANTARQLLGSCSSRYSAVAAEADGYRSQVIGLQDFVTTVCHAPSSADQ